MVAITRRGELVSQELEDEVSWESAARLECISEYQEYQEVLTE